MEKLTRDEAVAKITEWVTKLESADPDSKEFESVIDGLILPVRNGRLDYNADDDTFSLVLLKPIAGSKGATEILTFRELSTQDYKVTQRFKDDETIEKNEALIARSCGLPLGDVASLGSRDLTTAGTILSVFFS